jgi:hypothetical protein
MITPVGNRFLQYNPSTIAVPVVNPDVYVMVNSLSITPFSPSNTPGLVNYKFSLKFSNNLSSDRSTGVQIDIFDGPALIYSNQTDLPRCGGASQVVFLMNNLPPGEIHTFSAQINLLTGNGIDTNLVNNSFTFAPIVLQALLTTYFPAVYR